jgi:hypothetical protein
VPTDFAYGTGDVPVRGTIGLAQRSPNTKTTNQPPTSARANSVSMGAIEEAIEEMESLEPGEKVSYQTCEEDAKTNDTERLLFWG